MQPEINALPLILSLAIAVIYSVTVIALAVYGLNLFYLMFVAWRSSRQHIVVPPLTEFPMVTVQLPIYNERHVVERAINALCQFDWPHDRLEIQVLDDSTDATIEITAQAVAHWRTRGLNVVHLHRADRVGYKAGALQAGLAAAHGEYVAIFDADFVPPTDFIRRALPRLMADNRLGFVQARWGHLNRDASLLTMLQSIWIDGHFLVEQAARDHAGYVMNFNGTAGVWRRTAIEDAGGWSAGTLTEDLELSYRAALRGWKACLLPNLVAPAELVGEVSAYRRQQTRWAQGSTECAVRLLPRIWQSRLPRQTKIQSSFHLTGYVVQLLMLLMSLLYPLVLSDFNRSGFWHAFYNLSWVFAPIALVPISFFVYSQLRLNSRRWWRWIPYLFCLTVLGSGMVVNSARAILLGLRGRPAVFERTPKSGQIGHDRTAVTADYLPPFDLIVLVEIGLSIFNLNTARLAWQAHTWSMLVYALIFAAGLAYVAGLSIWETRRRWWHVPWGELEPEPAVMQQP